jgi:hypothetical protein
MQATMATRLAAMAAAVFLALAGAAYAAVPLTRVSSDPYSDPGSQHATEVEPDTFADHGVVVATFQVGRYFDGGATNIGAVRSPNAGVSWDAPVFLPGITFTAGAATNPFERVSDPSVAYDRAHGVWLISSLPIKSDFSVPKIAVSRSTDDGVTWKKPVLIPKAAGASDLDKNWTTCDNTPSSPFYGHCYTMFDNVADSNRLLSSTSTDGGLTWSVPVPTAGGDVGIQPVPVVQPNGTVVVPVNTFPNLLSAYRSTDGGASWSAATKIATPIFHKEAGGLRSFTGASAEADNAGNVYVTWPDCRFRAGCSANDIVYRVSSDGVSWGPVTRVPIDSTSSGADYFIQGIGVARGPGSAGSTAKLALTYYFYPVSDCGNTVCDLDVGFISSPDGGAHWSSPIQLAGPMSLDDLAQTSQGAMVGDYISTSFANGKATTVFPVGLPHTGSTFDEAMYAPATPLSIGSISTLHTTHSADRVTTAGSASKRRTKARRTFPRRLR